MVDTPPATPPAAPPATPPAGGPPATPPATPPAAPPAAPPTLAQADPNAPPATPPAGPKFSENWREILAGDDKAYLKTLERFASPADYAKSNRERERQISAGELKAPAKPLAADATPEQKAEWRKSNGLPENAEGYVKGLALPDGVVVGEADKPLLNEFAKSMFEQGASQTEMNRAVNWFFTQQQQVEAQRAEADSQLRIASEVALRQEWGQDYKPNMNAMGTLLDSMPEDLRVGVLTARTNDGRMVGNTPEFIKWAAQFARESNPTATIVAPGADATKTIETELAAIKSTYGKAMAGDSDARRAYYGHDGKPGLDARERELIDAQQKMSARGKAA